MWSQFEGGRKCRHDLRIKRQWSEWKTQSVFDNERCKYNLLCLYNIDVPRPLTNDLWVFPFQTIDAEYVKWASPARTYVYVKAFIVNVNKCLKPFFLEHINIVKRVTLQSFWLICSCLPYTQRKDSSHNHLHTLSSKLIIVRVWPLKDQTLVEST